MRASPASRNCRSPCAPRVRGLSLTWRSVLDPTTKDVDAFLRPCTVTGHGAVLQAVQDRGGMRHDVGMRPQIEGEAHRLPVRRPKERADMRLKRDAFRGARKPCVTFIGRRWS